MSIFTISWKFAISLLLSFQSTQIKFPPSRACCDTEYSSNSNGRVGTDNESCFRWLPHWSIIIPEIPSSSLFYSRTIWTRIEVAARHLPNCRSSSDNHVAQQCSLFNDLAKRKNGTRRRWTKDWIELEISSYNPRLQLFKLSTQLVDGS